MLSDVRPNNAFDPEISGCAKKRTVPSQVMPIGFTLKDEYGDWGEAIIIENGRKVAHRINAIRVLPDIFNGHLLLTLYEDKDTPVRKLDIQFEDLRAPLERHAKVVALGGEYQAPDTMTRKIVSDTVYDFRVQNALVGRGLIDAACAKEKVMLSDRMRHALFIELSTTLAENHTGKALG